MCYVGMWLDFFFFFQKSQMFAIHEIAHDDGVIMILKK